MQVNASSRIVIEPRGQHAQFWPLCRSVSSLDVSCLHAPRHDGRNTPHICFYHMNNIASGCIFRLFRLSFPSPGCVRGVYTAYAGGRGRLTEPSPPWHVQSLCRGAGWEGGGKTRREHSPRGALRAAFFGIPGVWWSFLQIPFFRQGERRFRPKNARSSSNHCGPRQARSRTAQ